MPTEAVKNRTFRSIFHVTARYEIPFFQRGYAWEKKQWDQLFVDLREQVLDELTSGVDHKSIEHFFGPIVVLEKSGSNELKEFLIIDGQQRITTVYLLLGAIKLALESKRHLSDEADREIVDLSKFLRNDVAHSNDDYMQMKVFSSKGDRLPTFRCIFGTDSNPKTPLLARDQELYIPGKNRIDEFQAYAQRKLKADYNSVPALVELKDVLLDCLKVVWIPLDGAKDDPQAIFESLNDKGMPLKASELLCNYLFQPIINADLEFEDLHNDLWLKSQRMLNGNEQFEECLRSLFSIGENKTVGKNRKVYIFFKNKYKNLTANQARTCLQDINRAVKLYGSVVDPIVKPYIDTAIREELINISCTRMESSTPFVLSVLIALERQQIDNNLARAILRETLVLLVRRKMTEGSTTIYDVMFPSLLGKIADKSNPISLLQEQFKKNNVYTSDQDFRNALIYKPLYKTRDLAFSRMMLVEIDKSFQSFGQLPDYSTVRSIEHTLPQTPDQQWKDYLGADANSDELECLTHTVGNLCLLSGPANSSVGRNPFESKSQNYSDVTALARQIKKHTGLWNLSAIKGRSGILADAALKIWRWS